MFQSVDTEGTLSASRIDMVLANHSAMQLLQDAWVLETVQDGGHSPVMVTVRLHTPAVLHWHRPKPVLPEVLRGGSAELQQSSAWPPLLAQWLASSAVAALDQTVLHTATTLSNSLEKALQHLVALAGGWVHRQPIRHPAYDCA